MIARPTFFVVQSVDQESYKGSLVLSSITQYTFTFIMTTRMPPQHIAYMHVVALTKLVPGDVAYGGKDNVAGVARVTRTPDQSHQSAQSAESYSWRSISPTGRTLE